ncbi:MAG: hypothetical protein WC782_16285 [Methylococcaceae bacterium]|jgi:uncharacterized protein with HEPN domain
MPLLKIEEAGVAVLTLTEGIEEEDFFRSRLTKQEVCRQITILSHATLDIPAVTRDGLPEINWQTWFAIAEHPTPDNQQLWLAISELIPTTLLWLRVYRTQQPELFNPVSA